MKRIACLVFALFSLQAHAHFGPSTGSGNGYAVVCRDINGIVHSATLLDLVEAVQRYRLSLPQATGSIELDYKRALANRYKLEGLKPIDLDVEAAGDLQRFFAKVQFSQASLISLDDMGQVVADIGNCKLEPVAIFHDDVDQVEINQEIFNSLDSTNQAALISHENYYRYERGLSEKTSEVARLLVAHMFSDSVIQSVDDGVPVQRLLCVTSGTEGQDSQFYAYQSGGTTVLQFRSIMGRNVITKATVPLASGFLTVLASAGGAVSKAAVAPEMHSLLSRSSMTGAYGQEWEVEAVYSAGQPVTLRLYEKGVIVAEAPVTACTPNN